MKKAILFTCLLIIVSLSAAVAGQEISTQTIQMTGLRHTPQKIHTQSIQMTGMRVEPFITDAFSAEVLEMTGTGKQVIMKDSVAKQRVPLRSKEKRTFGQSVVSSERER